MNVIHVSWCCICIACGYATAWLLAIFILPSQLVAARFLGAAAGLLLSYVLPRLLVRQLLEKPRSPSASHLPASPQMELPASPLPIA